MPYESVIGLEIHAQLLTRSKMFCSCPVVDLTETPPNTAVCPICSGMPGTLPVINEQAVAYALRVALALNCQVHLNSVFARKNYFYPDLPKGYQISQYEQPLAEDGRLTIRTSQGERDIRIRRVHLEEDTGKLTHVDAAAGEASSPDEPAGFPSLDSEKETAALADRGSAMTAASEAHSAMRPFAHSLIDLNRAGVPLLEIVTEPDLHTPEEVGAYARSLRQLLQYLEVNTGDMQKGVLRIEPNISVRRVGQRSLGTRTEVKNLNSFRALERAVAYEIDRQVRRLEAGQTVFQETVGWDERAERTVPQRSKEEAHDYRYFPEPDLPPLLLDPAWVQAIATQLPELPYQRAARFQSEYDLNAYDAEVLTASRDVADYFEATLAAAPQVDPKLAANWITGDLFALLNQRNADIQSGAPGPQRLAGLLAMVAGGEINPASARRVLEAMCASDRSAADLADAMGVRQISDAARIARWVEEVLQDHPDQVQAYKAGKSSVANWLFGQVMRKAGGRADPNVVRSELNQRLSE